MKINGKDYTIFADGRLVKTAFLGLMTSKAGEQQAMQQAYQNAAIMQQLQSLQQAQAKANSSGFNPSGILGAGVGGIGAGLYANSALPSYLGRNVGLGERWANRQIEAAVKANNPLAESAIADLRRQATGMERDSFAKAWQLAKGGRFKSLLTHIPRSPIIGGLTAAGVLGGSLLGSSLYGR
jgi:hypothetical protein